MTRAAVIITPRDHGRRMSLDDFEFAEVEHGIPCELGRGTVVVVDVPNFRHMVQLNAVKSRFSAYEGQHPGRIAFLLTGSECKVLIPELESERHPDLSVYRTPPPSSVTDWATWVPEIVIEVVSPGSRHRDYEEKPEEYLRFGVREYWIIDMDRGEMLVHIRAGGRWRPHIVRPPQTYAPATLPGFAFDLAAVFEAAKDYRD